MTNKENIEEKIRGSVREKINDYIENAQWRLNNPLLLERRGRGNGNGGRGNGSGGRSKEHRGTI